MEPPQYRLGLKYGSYNFQIFIHAHTLDEPIAYALEIFNAICVDDKLLKYPIAIEIPKVSALRPPESIGNVENSSDVLDPAEI